MERVTDTSGNLLTSQNITILSGQPTNFIDFVIQGATPKSLATVTLSAATLNQIYSGTPRTVIAITDPSGLNVNITYNGSTTAPTTAGTYSIVGTISDQNYQGAANGTLTVAQATPLITWPTPSPIVYGIPLSGTQLDATASVAGAVGSLTVASAGIRSRSQRATPAGADEAYQAKAALPQRPRLSTGATDWNATSLAQPVPPNLAFAEPDSNGRYQIWTNVRYPIQNSTDAVAITSGGGANQESREPAWSRPSPGHPYGQIAYQFGAPGVRGIHVINPDGSGDTRVTPTGPPPGSQPLAPGSSYPCRDARDPAWSPDGRYIAYACLAIPALTVTTVPAGTYEIWVHDYTGPGGDFRVVGYSSPNALLLSPVWSPDGNSIAFVSGGLGGKSQIVRVDISAGVNNCQGVCKVYPMTNADFSVSDPTWSPDGSQIAFSSSRNGGHDIYVLSAACPETQQNCSGALQVTGGGNNTNPAWGSPDGRFIAFVSSGKLYRIAVNRWSASTSYLLGYQILDPFGHVWQAICLTTTCAPGTIVGTSGVSEPSWPPHSDQSGPSTLIVGDNTVAWTNVGTQVPVPILLSTSGAIGDDDPAWGPIRGILGIDVSDSAPAGESMPWQEIIEAGEQAVVVDTWQALHLNQKAVSQLSQARFHGLATSANIAVDLYPDGDNGQQQTSSAEQVDNALQPLFDAPDPRSPPGSISHLLNAISFIALDVERLDCRETGSGCNKLPLVVDDPSKVTRRHWLRDAVTEITAFGQRNHITITPIIYTSSQWADLIGCTDTASPECGFLTGPLPLWDAAPGSPDLGGFGNGYGVWNAAAGVNNAVRLGRQYALDSKTAFPVDTDLDVFEGSLFPSLASSSNSTTVPVTTTVTSYVLNNITLAFTKLITGGTAQVAASSTGPQPLPGYVTGTPATFYNLATTAIFSGTVQVCIDFSGIGFVNRGNVFLYHFEGGAWVNVTGGLDLVRSIICGSVTSLSPFAIFEPLLPVTPTGNLVYTPPAGTVLGAGSQVLSVTFTPTDTMNYTTATAFVTLQVNPAPASVILNPASLTQGYDGTVKSVTVTTSPPNLTVSVTYSQNGTTVAAPTNVGTYNVAATITDPNYQGAATGTLTISGAGGCIAAPPGLVSWWTGDGNTGDLLGVNNSFASNVVTFVPGEVGTGFTLGSGGYIDVLASPSLANQQFTWSAWARPDGPGPNNDSFGSVIVGQDIDGSHASVQILWRATDNRFLFVFGNNASELIVSTDSFAPGHFYLVTSTYDGSTFKLFVNGALEGQLTLAKTIAYSSLTWTIGSTDSTLRGSFPRTWNGVIDEVQAFNRALSQSEIQAIYSAGSAGECKVQPPISSVVPNTGEQGQQNLSVALAGQLTKWVQGMTTASFGAGITVVSLTVNSSTSATAVINIDPAAVAGARTITLTTGTEVDTLTNGFAVGPPADLTVTKTHSGTFKQGDTGDTYTITVTNSGTGPTVGVVTMSDTIPVGLTATAISGTGWTCPSGTLTSPITCTRSDSLAAAASYPVITVTVNVAANAAASVTNTVTVSGGGESNTANDTASDVTTITPVLIPDLTIIKTHTGNFTQGQIGATYTITVTNSGTGPTVGVVTMSDALPSGLTATAINGTGWTCPTGTLTSPVSCTRSDVLGAATSYPAITLTVNVANNAASSLTNMATVSGGGEVNTANDTASDVTTITQVACLASPSGLVSWWAGDGSTSDLLGTNNPSASNAVTFVPGEVGTGFTFGSGGYIDIPASPSLANQQFTWSAWVRPDGAGPNNDFAGNSIVDQDVDNYHVSVSLSWRATDNSFVFAVGDIQSPELITSQHAFAPGQFYFVTGTYDGSTFKLFVNGALEGQLTEAKTISYSAISWTIGAASPNIRVQAFPRTWNGVIDEVQAFNRALSQSEIQAIYSAGSAGECKVQPPISSVVPNTGEQGQQNLSVALAGQLTKWVQGMTTASFGAGITMVSLTVNSSTSATAVINIDPAAVAGARTITLTTGTEVDTLTNGFAVGPPADLTVTKTHSGTFKQGDTGDTYTITVTNSGGGPTVGVVTMSDTIPVGLTATAISGTGWTCPTGTLTSPVTCTRSDALAAAASYPAITLTVNVAANAAASVTNTVAVSGGGELNTANDTASDVTAITPVLIPDLTIIKTHTGNFTQGQIGATYTITVTNSGAGPTAGVVTMSDALPSGLTATAISGTGWTCPTGTLTSPVSCTRSDVLGAASSYPIITLTVNVANNAPVSVTNTAVVSGGGESNTSNDSASDPTTINPTAVPTFTEYPIPTGASNPNGITAGPDGNLWFIEGAGNKLGKITTAGTITEFPLPTGASNPQGITAGPDGNLWFTEGSGKIGRITTAGVIAEFPIPTGGFPLGITAGSDGNLWFVERFGNNIGRITPGGVMTEFPIPTAGSQPYEITAGPDSNLWFAEFAGNQIGRITPAGVITEFPVPTGGSSSYAITAGPDGNLWFAEAAGNKIGKITTAGAITEYPVPTNSSSPTGITAGPDGNLWFAEVSGNNIGRITTTGVITEFSIPAGGIEPEWITTGPDGNLWFTEYTGNKIVKANIGFGGALPDLTITKTHTGNFTQGQTGAVYTITVSNGGTGLTVGTVTVTDTLPAGLTATAITGTGWTCGTLTCTRSDTLAAGASYPAITLTVNVAANAPASVTNTVTVAGGGELNTANDTASDVATITPVLIPDLTITKTHSGNFTQGQTGATYTITVSNIGTGPTVGVVTMSDALPTGLTATAINGAGWTCPTGTLTSPVACTRSDALAAGGSYPAITLTVNVASNAPASVTNTAVVSGGGETNTSNDSASDVTTITAPLVPDLTITKSHTGNFTQGQIGATYTITVTNSGTAFTTGTVTLIDTLPTGLTATAIVGTGWSCTLANLTCTRSDALGATASYPAITLTVNVATNAAASVTNTATVSGGGELNTTNDSANDVTGITQSGVCLAPPSGLVSWWPLDGSGGDIVDGNSGTVTGGQFVPAEVGSGFNSSQGIVSVPSASNLNVSQFTIETWLRADDINPENRLIVWKGETGGGEDVTTPYALEVSATSGVTSQGKVFGTAAPGKVSVLLTDGVHDQAYFSNSALPVGTFHHVAATVDGQTVQIYIDGKLDAAYQQMVTPFTSSSTPFQIGGIVDTTNHFLGVIDELSLYNRALTSAEIQAIFNTGSAGKCKGSGTLPDLTITKTHTGNFTQGQTGAVYTITVSNGGTGLTVGTVTVTDTLPAGLTATAITGTGWTCGTLTCTRSDTLAAGASYPAITLTVNVAANAPASVTNTVTVAGGGELNTANDTASDVATITPVLIPDLTITKTHSGNFTQGQTGATYTITVSNIGTGPTIGVVTMSDALPTGLTATAINGAGWTCPTGTLTSPVACTRSDTLAAGTSHPAITITVNVAANAPASVTNTVTVAGGGEVNTQNDAANDVTSIGQISACKTPPSGLIHWWPGDGNVNDIIGSDNGTLQNGASFGQGEVGYGFSFNNAGVVSIPAPNDMNLTSVTLEAWIQLNASPPSGSDYVMATKGIGTSTENYGLYVRSVGSGLELMFEWGPYGSGSGNHQVVSTGSGLTAGVFRHVAVTADGVNVTFYVDGKSVSQIAQVAPLVSSAGSFQIGSDEPSLANRFNGVIDELSLYSRALSQSEIQAIYAAGSTGKCKPPSQTYAISGLPFSVVNSISPAAGPRTYSISGLPFSIMNSISPAAGPRTYSISGLPFSIINSVSPAAGPRTYSISGLPFSIMNSISPAAGPRTYSISGLPFSIVNSISPALGPRTYSISGLPFSIVNSISPALGPRTYSISGLPFSIRNSISPALGPQTYSITGRPFSILNSTSTQSTQKNLISGLTSPLTNGFSAGFPPASTASLHFWLPVDPAFVFEALARGAQRIDGKPVCVDSDNDGICDMDELIIGTNPYMADTDGDGYPDGLELLYGSDPLNPASIPDIHPPGYYVTPPVSILNIIPFARLTPRRQGATYAKDNR